MTVKAESTSANSITGQEYLILKSNLYKFLKVLRVKNRAIYKLLLGLPVSTVWIEIFSKDSGISIDKLSFYKFTCSFRSLPSKGVSYRIYYKTYSFSNSEKDFHIGENVYVATYRNELTFDFIPSLLAYLCYEKYVNGLPKFLQSIEEIRQFKFKRKDIDRIGSQVEEYNQKFKELFNN